MLSGYDITRWKLVVERYIEHSLNWMDEMNAECDTEWILQ